MNEWVQSNNGECVDNVPLFDEHVVISPDKELHCISEKYREITQLFELIFGKEKDNLIKLKITINYVKLIWLESWNC